MLNKSKLEDCLQQKILAGSQGQTIDKGRVDTKTGYVINDSLTYIWCTYYKKYELSFIVWAEAFCLAYMLYKNTW